MRLVLLLIFTFCSYLQLQAQWQIVWSKAYGGSDNDVLRDIVKTSDGGYIMIGNTLSSDGDITGKSTVADEDIWVVKLDKNFKVQWQHTHGGTGVDQATNIIELPRNKGYAFSANTTSADGEVNYQHGQTDIWIVQIDKSGKIVWSKTYGGKKNDYMNIGNTLTATADGGYILTGITNSGVNDGDVDSSYGENDIWVAKLAEYGKIEWAKSFGGDKNDESVGIEPAHDSGYILAGQSYTQKIGDTGNYGMGDAWVLQLSDTGRVNWQKNYGGTNWDIARAIHKSSNGQYIFVGNTRSKNMDITRSFGDIDFWVMYMHRDGTIDRSEIHGGPYADIGRDIIEVSKGLLAIGTKPDGAGSDMWVTYIYRLLKPGFEKQFGSSTNDTSYNLLAIEDTSFLMAGQISAGDKDAKESGYHGMKDIWLVKLSFFTGIEGLNANEKLQVYPTVTNGLVNIDLPESCRNAEIRLVNSMGQTVDMTVEGNELKKRVKLQDMPNGVYHLFISTATSAYMYRIVYQQ